MSTRACSLLLVLIASGCGGGSDDPPDAPPPDAPPGPADAAIDAPPGGPQITATITVSSAGPGPVTCQQGHPVYGTDAIRINARLSGTSGVGFSDVYDCDVVQVTTPPLTTGNGEYDVWIDYVSDRNQADPTDWVVVGTTAPRTVQVNGNTAIDADLVLDAGFFELSWRLVRAGAPVTCAQVAGEDGVSLLGTAVRGGAAYEDLYNCEDGSGGAGPVITARYPLGAYTLSLSILDASGAAIGQAPPVSSTLVDGNDYNDLGMLTITVP